MQSKPRTELPPILAEPRRKNMLADIEAFPKLPRADEITKATIDITNIQYDIVVGQIKKLQTFVFFSVENATEFKSVLRSDVCALITPVAEMLPGVEQPQVALNLAFSQAGLHKLGITADLKDEYFKKSQVNDAEALGDAPTNWKPVYANSKALHGVFLVASDDIVLVDAGIAFLRDLFGQAMSIISQLPGNIREDKVDDKPMEGHEMFGWLDGISQPHIKGFGLEPSPGQMQVPPGIILVGGEGDSLVKSRPKWAKDGSFLAFRELQQHVPEFLAFLNDNAPRYGDLTDDQSVKLFGARLFGRWKSGSPVQLTPHRNDHKFDASDLNNDFTFADSNHNLYTDQSLCPFHAHIRKVRPRADVLDEHGKEIVTHAIMRAGIPYGKPATPEELTTSTSEPALERGLAFVAYQSQIGEGFRYLQRQANDPTFARDKDPSPGWDPIIGQNKGKPRWISGYNPRDPNAHFELPKDFIVSRGGEYFFAPSLKALREEISEPDRLLGNETALQR